MKQHWLKVLVAWLLLGVASIASAQTRQVALPELEAARCAPLLTFKKDSGLCEPEKPADLKKLDEKACPKTQGFAFDKDKKECTFDAKSGPPPTCNPAVANLVYDATAKVCRMVVGQPTSGAGDFVGDCFEVPEGSVVSDLKPGTTYTVTGQQDAGKDDRQLSLVEGKMYWWPIPGIFGCSVKNGPVHGATASSLMEAGAQRFGWAYGALTMPYKYYPHSKNFVTGLPPIGAYLGWRTGRAGSGLTMATALTLSTVKADTLDPNTLDADGKPTVTGSADVAALSFAVGLVFDISKRPGFKPFKAGVFVGQDRINRSKTVSYQNDGKTWIALQLGFDFTDN